MTHVKFASALLLVVIAMSALRLAQSQVVNVQLPFKPPPQPQTPPQNDTVPVSTNQEVDDLVIYQTIVNRHDFRYTLNPEYDICGKEQSHNVFLLIYVHTAPDNFKRRLSIRETWAKRSMFRDLRVVFMMGATTDKKVKELLKLESGIYNDIVQEDFLDSYKNLTYKGIMAMKWISQYCKDVRLILKVDDDIITNIFILMRHLKNLEEHKLIKEKTIMCLVWEGMSVIREKGSKWYVSKEDFKPNLYMKYCSGSAYMLSGDLPASMFNASWYVKFFWVDDYFVTGRLARAVNVSHMMFNSLYIISTNLVEQRFFGRQSSSAVFGHIPGGSSINKMYFIWSYILNNQLNHFPGLHRSNANFLVKNDFNYVKDLHWGHELWEQFFTPPKITPNIENDFKIESF